MADQPRYIDPDEGAVGKAARHYRTLVAQADRQATQTLARQYDLIAAKLSSQLEAVLADIARTEAAGLSPAFTQLYRRERLAMLLQEVGVWFQQATRAAGVAMGPAVQTAVQLGEQAAAAAINARLTGQWENAPAGTIAPPGPGQAAVGFNALPHDAIAELTGVLQPGSPVAELLDGFGAEAQQKAGDLLTEAVAQGLNPLTIKKQLAEVLQIGAQRALTIARTEIWRAYRTATMRTYQANSHLVKGWIWRCHLSDRTCAACLAMHGTVHRLDEDMGMHPNCRCVAVPQTNSWDDIYRKYGLSGPRPPERSASWSTNRPGQDWLRNRPDDEQDRVLGGELAGNLFRAGDVELRDFIRVRRSSKWGKTVSRGTARQALTTANKRMGRPAGHKTPALIEWEKRPRGRGAANPPGGSQKPPGKSTPPRRSALPPRMPTPGPAAQPPAPLPSSLELASTGMRISPHLPAPTQAELRAALDATDQVHGIRDMGLVRQILIHRETGRGRAGGFYYSRISGGRYFPGDIRISPNATVDQKTTLLHELGHYMDLWHIGPQGHFTSEHAPSMAPGGLLHNWKLAIDRSAAHQSVVAQTADRNPAVRKMAKYLAGYDEAWARSYAQWVAKRSGDKGLQQAIQRERIQKNLGSAGPEFVWQWEESDFAEISDALDVIFTQEGLLK